MEHGLPAWTSWEQDPETFKYRRMPCPRRSIKNRHLFLGARSNMVIRQTKQQAL
jgi:hypothetical protein